MKRKKRAVDVLPFSCVFVSVLSIFALPLVYGKESLLWLSHNGPFLVVVVIAAVIGAVAIIVLLIAPPLNVLLPYPAEKDLKKTLKIYALTPLALLTTINNKSRNKSRAKNKSLNA